MYRASDFKKNCYKVGEVAEILGVSTKTVRNYDRDGKLKMSKTDDSYRTIHRDDLIKFLIERNLFIDDSGNEKHDVIYARISRDECGTCNGDKYNKNDYENMSDFILGNQAFCVINSVPNLVNLIVMKEVGERDDENREKLVELIDMITSGQVRNVYVTRKDRLAGRGLNYIEKMFSSYGVEIIEVMKGDVDSEKEIVPAMDDESVQIFVNVMCTLYRKNGFGDAKGYINDICGALAEVGYDGGWIDRTVRCKIEEAMAVGSSDK